MWLDPSLTPSFSEEDVSLCLRQVYEGPLPDFEPIGLTTSNALGANPMFAMWSDSTLLVAQLSSTGETVTSLVQRTTPNLNPLSVALTNWGVEGPTVEVLGADDGRTWTIDMSTGEVIEGTAIVGAPTASAALRRATGWVQAHKLELTDADLSSVVLTGAHLGGLHRADLSAKPSGRYMDRLLHLRSDNRRGLMVQEAGFPFATIGYADDGIETWRILPEPDAIRGWLDENDLRYVIATPAVPLDDAVLNTFVALRSGRRIAAIRQHPDAAVRYREIPRDLAFLGSFATPQLLVATRSGQPYRLVIFSWRWVDRRERCTNPPE